MADESQPPVEEQPIPVEIPAEFPAGVALPPVPEELPVLSIPIPTNDTSIVPGPDSGAIQNIDGSASGEIPTEVSGDVPEVGSAESLFFTEISGFMPNLSISAELNAMLAETEAEIPNYGMDISAPETVKNTYSILAGYLKQQSGDAPSMYEQLKSALRLILKTKNKSAYDSFEQILASVGQPVLDRSKGNAKMRETSKKEALLDREMFKVDGAIEDRVDTNLDEETGNSKLPNLLRQYPFLTNSGIPRLFSVEKANLLNISMKKLMDFDSKIQTIRFWGVIFGLKADYYIAETDADPPDDEEEDPEPAEMEEEEEKIEPEIEEFENLPPVPKTMVKPLPPLIKEMSGTGVNRKAYFVANKANLVDGAWTRLSPLTPDQVIISRKIHRGFTGNLTAKVPSFPIFPGLEENYLHAQIVRISAATHICPSGFYILDDEEDFDEDSAPPFNLIDNPEYKSPSFIQLCQPHMKFWTHYGQYILRQGRTFYYDAFEANKDEDEDEELDEDEDAEKVRRPKYPVWYPEKADWYEPEETVPPPLSSVMNDAAIDGYPPWSIHFGSKTFPSQSFMIARSNLWPGAYCVVHDQAKSFFNIYIGKGVKYRSHFVPQMPGHVKHERYDPTLNEEVDPTPEEEEEIRKAAGLNEEEREKGEEEEEEEEDTK